MSDDIAPQTPPQERAQLVAPGAPVRQRRRMNYLAQQPAEQNPHWDNIDENGPRFVPLQPRRLWPEEEVGIVLQNNANNDDDFRNRQQVQIPDNWRFLPNANQRN